MAGSATVVWYTVNLHAIVHTLAAIYSCHSDKLASQILVALVYIRRIPHRTNERFSNSGSSPPPVTPNKNAKYLVVFPIPDLSYSIPVPGTTLTRALLWFRTQARSLASALVYLDNGEGAKTNEQC